MNTSFSVSILFRAELDINVIIEAARDEATEERLRDSFQNAVQQIRSDARSCGEPLYEMKQMKMRVCRIVVAPLYVEFGVHFSQPSAFIRRVVLLQ